ncbi:MAG: polysaccharide biosynthesis C-terminal domain-containing protein [Bacteroidota bacterium]
MSLVQRLKKLASETAIYGLSSIVGRMLNFLLFPYYSGFFPPDVYAPIGLLYISFVFFNILYQYGMESAYLKYAAAAEAKTDKQRVFTTVTVSLVVSSVALSGLILLLREPVGLLVFGGGASAQDLNLLNYGALILLLDALTVIPYAALRLENRAIRFAVIRFINIGVNVGLNVLLLTLFEPRVEFIVIANAVASGVALLLLVPEYARNVRAAFDAQLWRQLLAFGLPFIPGGLGYAVAERVNVFFLDRMTDEQVRALYGSDIPQGVADAPDYVVGAFTGIMKLVILMGLFVQMFRYAWQPFFLNHAKDDDAPQLFATTFTVLHVGLLFVLLGLSFYVAELVAWDIPGSRTYLIAPSYWMALPILPIGLLGYLFQGWYYTFSAGAYLTNKTKLFVPCTLAGAAVAVVVNALLVPHSGMVAAAWATTLAYATMALLLWLLIRRHYAVPYQWGRVLLASVVALALFLTWHYTPALQVWYVEAGLLAAYVVALLLLGIIPRRYLLRIIRRPS